MKTIDDWLKGVKKGDSVVRCSGYYGKSVEKVDRVTPTQIVLETGGKYRKSDGNQVGGSGYHIAYITEPTAELLNEIRKKFLCDKLRQVAWEKISVGVLADIWDKAKNGQHIATQPTATASELSE